MICPVHKEIHLIEHPCTQCVRDRAEFERLPSVRFDLDNPTDEQRPFLELYERTKRERDEAMRNLTDLRVRLFEAERQLAEERQEVELKTACIAGMQTQREDEHEQLTMAIDDLFGLQPVAVTLNDNICALRENVNERSRQYEKVHRERDDQTAEVARLTGAGFAAMTPATVAEIIVDRDAAIARANLEAAHHEHLRKERDEAHIRNYQETDEASAIAAALTSERDALIRERDHYKSIAEVGVVVTDFEAMLVERDDLRDKLRVSCEQFDAVGHMNEENVRLEHERDSALARAEAAERAADDYAKTIGTQHESVARIEARERERIAAWLEALPIAGVGECDWPGDLPDLIRAGEYGKEPR